MYPSHIPDLSSESPSILSGKYKGNFPETLKVEGILADFSNFALHIKIQKAKDIPVQRVKYSILGILITKLYNSSFCDFEIISAISGEENPNLFMGAGELFGTVGNFFEI